MIDRQGHAILTDRDVFFVRLGGQFIQLGYNLRVLRASSFCICVDILALRCRGQMAAEVLTGRQMAEALYAMVRPLWV
jgi:hypothetical protein